MFIVKKSTYFLYRRSYLADGELF